MASWQQQLTAAEARVEELEGLLCAARKGLPWSPAAHEVGYMRVGILNLGGEGGGAVYETCVICLGRYTLCMPGVRRGVHLEVYIWHKSVLPRCIVLPQAHPFATRMPHTHNRWPH